MKTRDSCIFSMWGNEAPRGEPHWGEETAMYELRDNWLYCDGDLVGVRSDIVQFAAMALHLPKAGPIPDAAAHRMIALERKMLLVAVARTVRDVHAAGGAAA